MAKRRWFDAEVKLPGAEIEDNRLAGFREVAEDAVGTMLTKRRYREELEEKILRTIQNERAMTHQNRVDMMEDEEWFDGVHYRNDTLAQTVPEMENLTHNIVRHPVEYIIATAKTLKLEGSVVPTGGSNYTDRQFEEIARAYDVRLKIAQDQGGFRKAKDRAIDDAAVAGVGYWESVLRYHRESGSHYVAYRHLPWKNVYKDSNVQGMEDARYCYHLQSVDMRAVLTAHPRHEQDIRQMSEEYSNLVAVDRGYHAYQHHLDNRDASVYGGGGHTTGMSEHTRPMVIYGRGWFKEDMVDSNGVPVQVTVRVIFIMDETFDRVKLLQDPKFVYGHNQIPVTEFGFAYRRVDNQPFSPPIRNLIGLQKTVRILLRFAILNLSSRGAIVDIESLPVGMDPNQYVEDIENRLLQSVYVLPRYGEKAVEVLENERRHDQLFAALTFCMNVAKESTGIHPQLMGEKTGVDAAVAMKRLADDAMRIQHRFFTHLTEAVKHSSELTLSMIEQYGNKIEYPARQEGGRIIRATADGDRTIRGNRATFHVVPITREETLNDALFAYVTELTKTFPNIGASMLPSMARMAPIADALNLSDDLKGIVRAQGLPVPQSTLTPEEREQQAMQSQEQQQAQKAMQDAELRKVQSEAMKNQAAAMKSESDAVRPSESTELSELRDTIARLERENSGLRRRG